MINTEALTFFAGINIRVRREGNIEGSQSTRT